MTRGEYHAEWTARRVPGQAGSSMRAMRRARGGWSALETMTVLAGLCAFLAIAMFGYFRYQERVHVRLCHSQQRQLQGQLETIPSPDLDCSIEELFDQLRRAGLLSNQPADPGSGEGSYKNYQLMAGSRMFGCKIHGSPFAEELF